MKQTFTAGMSYATYQAHVENAVRALASAVTAVGNLFQKFLLFFFGYDAFATDIFNAKANAIFLRKKLFAPI